MMERSNVRLLSKPRLAANSALAWTQRNFTQLCRGYFMIRPSNTRKYSHFLYGAAVALVRQREGKMVANTQGNGQTTSDEPSTEGEEQAGPITLNTLLTRAFAAIVALVGLLAGSLGKDTCCSRHFRIAGRRRSGLYRLARQIVPPSFDRRPDIGYLNRTVYPT